MASNFGRDSTYRKVADRFSWYSIYNDVADFVESCEVCQNKSKARKYDAQNQNELRSIPIPERLS